MPTIEHETQAQNIGTNIILTVKKQDGTVADISTATTKQYRLQKKDGTVITRVADFVGDGSDGKLTYNTIQDDIPEADAGIWLVQVYLVMTGVTGYSNTFNVRVWPNLV